MGFPVTDYRTAKKKYGEMVVLVCFGTHRPEVMAEIERLAGEQELYAPDVPVTGEELFTRAYAEAHREELERVYGLLADEQSRRVLRNVAEYKLTGRIELLRGCGLQTEAKKDFIDTRRRTVFHRLSAKEKAALIKENPLYGRVICRCETVTEGEIVDALHRPIVPTSIDAIKRRCNAGMGRCQGGFCGPRVHEIIARELGVPKEQVLMDEEGSWLLCGQTKTGKGGDLQ